MKSSREPGLYDVFPCTWVSQDRPSLVEVVQGALFVDGFKLMDISELKAPSIDGNNSLPAQSTFNMEPGKSIFVVVRYCNAAERCAEKEVAVIVISKEDTISLTSANGEPILLSSDGSPSGRKKRSTSGITVETPGGMSKNMFPR